MRDEQDEAAVYPIGTTVFASSISVAGGSMTVLDRLRELTEAALRFDGEIHGDSFLLDMQAREKLISVA